MIANNNAITDMIDMIDRIALGMGIEIPNGKLSEFQDEITKALVEIDITMYYQLLDLFEDVEMVRKMVTKYNLLLADNRERELSDSQKIEIMGFILSFARKIGNEKYLYEKIERDYEFEKGKQ